MTMELHPLCTLFPRLAGDEFAALVADIRAHGLRQPIVRHDGMVLDGGNRYRACIEAGVEPRFVDFDGDNAAAFVLSANLHRRHMTPGQQAAIVASAQDWAKAQRAGGTGANQHQREQSGNVAGLQTVATRAAQSGASERTQRMADRVARDAPDLARKVAHGEVTLPAAAAQVEGKQRKRKPAAAQAAAPGPDDGHDAGPDAATLLDEMAADLRRAEARAAALEKRVAELEALMAGDADKMRVIQLMRRAEHAERRCADLMDDAAKLKARADRYEKTLARIGRAVGERDLDRVAPAVEALARRAKVAA